MHPIDAMLATAEAIKASAAGTEALDPADHARLNDQLARASREMLDALLPWPPPHLRDPTNADPGA